MGGRTGHRQVRTQRRDLTHFTGLRCVSEVPFHPQFTQAFFTDGHNLRRQFHLLDGQIHLHSPALEHIHHRLVIPDQETVGALVDGETAFRA